MKNIIILIILISLFGCKIQNKQTTIADSNKTADSLYNLAWKKHNTKKFNEAGKLFEQSIEAGNVWSGVYLNAASSWANANNESKVFENLFKLVNANYLDKKYIIRNFPAFYKYYDTNEWKQFISKMNSKQKHFNKKFSKTKLKKLTKEQMFQDYDTLVSILIKNSPHLKVRSKVCNIDYETLFKTYRDEIKYCNTNTDFALILKKNLISCQDGHTSFTSLNPWNCLSDGNSIEKCASIAKYQDFFNFTRTSNYDLPKLVYHNGSYYLSEAFYSIPKKSELISVNNQSPQDFIKNNFDKKRNLSWDFQNNSFYSKYFLSLDIAYDSLQLSFKNKIKVRNVNVKPKGKPKKIKINRHKDGSVWYWKEQKILYIRMPHMSNGEFYYNKIIKYSQKPINKIIVDIRNNPGGGNSAWYYVLNAIFNVNIAFDSEMGLNTKKANDLTSKKIDEINFYVKKLNTVIPNAPFKNLNYKGKIYVFYNEQTFSSAGSLVNTCYYDEQLVSVGMNTGKILGFGINPKTYSLPNSQLTFRVEPLIDLTNSNNYKDIFHDEPELKMELNLDEKILLRNQSEFTKDFIKEYDPYVKRILEIK